MRLIDEQFFAAHEETRDRMAALSVPADPLPAPFDQAALDTARAYLLLTDFPDEVLKHGYSAEEVFWSRWYWIQRYVKLRNAFGCHDAGLEQQAFQILESYDYHDFEHHGWEARAKMLDARAARDVEALIGRAAAPAAPAVVLGVPEIPLATLRAKYAAPSSRFLTLSDRAAIHVRDEGPRSAPVIVMVPGLHSSLHVWDGWMAALHDNYRVIAVDLPGQGLSDCWPRNDYSIPALDGFITEVVSALGVARFTFVGHSMSGAMAWRYALAHPERIESLILVSAGGFVTKGAGPILPFRILASPIVGPIARRFITRPMVRRVLRRSYGNPDKVSDELVTRNFEMINGAGHRASLGQRLNYLLSYEPVSRIDGVRAPTLIVWGDQDRLRPVLYASMFHERIKDSVLRIHPGIGHFPMEEAPEATAADVRAFMDRAR